MPLSNIIPLQAVNSTNTYAKSLVLEQDVQEGTIVITAEQQSGRGTGANVWESEPGKNITCSFIFYPKFIEPVQFYLFNMSVALAVADTIESFLSDQKPICIKWPNDIYVADQKIAGILIESAIVENKIDHSIVGIGLNVNQRAFVSDAPNPVSICQVIGFELDLQIVLEVLNNNMLQRYAQLKSGSYVSIIECYHQKLYQMKKRIPFRKNDFVFYAIIDRVEMDGRLVLLDDKGTEQYYGFKEVEMVF